MFEKIIRFLEMFLISLEFEKFPIFYACVWSIGSETGIYPYEKTYDDDCFYYYKK